jgi:uncharacterized membrane protein (DUF106 family)
MPRSKQQVENDLIDVRAKIRTAQRKHDDAEVKRLREKERKLLAEYSQLS